MVKDPHHHGGVGLGEKVWLVEGHDATGSYQGSHGVATGARGLRKVPEKSWGLRCGLRGQIIY